MIASKISAASLAFSGGGRSGGKTSADVTSFKIHGGYHHAEHTNGGLGTNKGEDGDGKKKKSWAGSMNGGSSRKKSKMYLKNYQAYKYI
jgi:hypothetical protein